MKKHSFEIKVEIDPELSVHENGACRGIADENKWLITIGGKECPEPECPHMNIAMKDSYISTVCHEVGHVLGRQLGGEIMGDLDFMLVNMPAPFQHVSSNVIKEEERAWALGEKVFKRVRDWCLETYYKQVREQRGKAA